MTAYARVYAAIVASERRGMTEEDLRRALNMSGDTVRPRLWELRRDNKIFSGTTRRLPGSKRQARVWRAWHTDKDKCRYCGGAGCVVCGGKV